VRAVVTDNAGTSDTRWSAVRGEAVEALRDALVWNLPEPRWTQAGAAIAGMAAAVAAASLEGLRQTTAHLELCGPLRVKIRLGDTPPLPAPKATRERITELIDTLTRDDKKADDESARDRQPRGHR
jgi:hypothetical protein